MLKKGIFVEPPILFFFVNQSFLLVGLVCRWHWECYYAIWSTNRALIGAHVVFNGNLMEHTPSMNDCAIGEEDFLLHVFERFATRTNSSKMNVLYELG